MLSELPEGWASGPMLDFFQLQRGHDLPVQDRNPGTVPIIASNGVVGFHDQSSLGGPGVITGRSGSIGNVNFVEGAYWPLNTTLYARDFKGSDPKFVYYFLQNFPLKDHSTGTGVPTLNRNDVHAVEIVFPPLDEQRRIAEVLRSVDEAITIAERVATQGRSTLDALFFQYFCSSGAGTSNSELVPLSALVSLQSGFAFKSQEYEQKGHFLIRIGNVQDGKVSLDNPKFVKLDKKTQPFELEVGDLVTSLTGHIGRVARLAASHLPAALNQRVARIKPRSSADIDGNYLFFALQSPLFKDWLAEESGGAAQQNVSPKAIGRVEIPLPTLDEQERIGEFLLSVENAVSQAAYSASQLKDMRAILMADLLSGHVRVPA